MQDFKHMNQKTLHEFNEHETHEIFKFKGSVREKLKGVQAQCDKKALLIATNLTSICCVYKEKIVKNDLY